jgi:hypothetical protein
MPKVVESAESGKMHSHVMVTLLPIDTINSKIPNSCQACHKHKKDDMKKLQEKAFPGSMDQLDW